MTTTRFLASLPLVLLAACDPPRDPGPPVPEFVTTPDETFTPRADRVIGRLATGQSCPAPTVADWSLSPLFDGTSAPELSRFCLYTRDRSSQSDGPFSDLRPQPGVLDIGVPGLELIYDPVVLAPAGTQPDLAEGLARRFRQFAGQPDWESGAPSVLTVVPRLALIDSSPLLPAAPQVPNAYTEAGRGPHGFLLAQLVRTLACPGFDTESCLVDLTSRPALDFGTPPFPGVIDPSEPDAAWQGSWGTTGALAQAIFAEVKAWRAEANPRPLVINLSVAWHPYFTGSIFDGIEVGAEGDRVAGRRGEQTVFDWSKLRRSAFNPDVDAVYLALGWARCHGALVIAAAGNRTAGVTGTDGPMLPAGWASMPGSLMPDCTALGVDGPPPDLSSMPLLYAVGAVDADLEDLEVSRPNSRPPFLAYGDHAVSERGVNEDDAPLTGTSIASIVVSTTAALAWAQQPELTPAQLMQQLYDAATPVAAADGPFVDIEPIVLPSFSGGAPDSAHLIETCKTLQKFGGRWPCVSDVLAELPAPIVDAATPSVVEDLSKELAMPACGATHAIRYSAGLVWPTDRVLCPAEQYFSPQISPWVYPQPQGGECPFCLIDVAIGRLYLEFDRPLQWFDGLTVTLKTSTNTKLNYTLPTSLLGPEIALDLRFDPTQLAGVEFTGAALTMVKGEVSVISQLLLVTP